MRTHNFRAQLARVATIGAAVAAASFTIGVGAGVASAAPGDPPGGAVPVAPHFYNGNVEAIRGAGSDTTYYVMTKISDLFNGAGLYGCSLNSSAGTPLYNSSDPASATNNLQYYCASGANVPTTDTSDNWDRTEVTEGVDDIGATPGQEQLCGTLATPLPVDFGRAAKPPISVASGGCSTEQQTGFAKDSVPIIDYPINPSVYGTSTFTGTTTFQSPGASAYPDTDYAAINGGQVGDVAEGWLPGDALNCLPNNGSNPTPFCSGTALGSISNADGGTSNNSGGVDSTAYRIWCSSDETGDAASRIIDWGQLTNLGPNLWVDGVSASNSASTITASSVYPSEGTFPSTVANGDAVTGSDIPSGTTVLSGAGTGTLTLSNAPTTTQTTNVQINTGSSILNVGQGAPVGVAIRAIGVNTGSGIESTFAGFAESGFSGGGCASNMNTNDQYDPNTATATGDDASKHVALQNNSDQLDQFAAADFPNPDYVDQAIEVATTLYNSSNGIFNTNPYAAASTIDGTSYSGNKVELNGVIDSTTNELNNKFPTAITLGNIYRSDTVRASTGGFLNWICDSNSNFLKGLDNSTGLNFDNEITTLISTTSGFPRVSDVTANPAVLTPADGIAAPNNTCAASLPITTTTGSNTVTLTAGGNFPPDIVNAGQVYTTNSQTGVVAQNANVTVTGAGIPAGTYVVSGGGTNTLTLSQNVTTGASGVATVFGGVPAVTAVANTQS